MPNNVCLTRHVCMPNLRASMHWGGGHAWSMWSCTLLRLSKTISSGDGGKDGPLSVEAALWEASLKVLRRGLLDAMSTVILQITLKGILAQGNDILNRPQFLTTGGVGWEDWELPARAIHSVVFRYICFDMRMVVNGFFQTGQSQALRVRASVPSKNAPGYLGRKGKNVKVHADTTLHANRACLRGMKQYMYGRRGSCSDHRKLIQKRVHCMLLRLCTPPPTPSRVDRDQRYFSAQVRDTLGTRRTKRGLFQDWRDHHKYGTQRFQGVQFRT